MNVTMMIVVVLSSIVQEIVFLNKKVMINAFEKSPHFRLHVVVALNICLIHFCSMLELLVIVSLLALMGAILGIICGLVPGLHQNNVAILLVLFFPLYMELMSKITDPDTAFYGFISMFIAAMCTHNFSDVIGAMLTGVPDASETFTLQPAQRLLMKGAGMQVVHSSVIGSFLGIMFGLALLLPVKMILTEPLGMYEKIKPLVPVVLACVCALIVLSEKGKKYVRGKKFLVFSTTPDAENTVLKAVKGKVVWLSDDGRRGIIVRRKYRIKFELKERFQVKKGDDVCFYGLFIDDVHESHVAGYALAFFVFLLSGILGWTVLFTPVAHLTAFTLLFPLFTGLFGVAGLSINLTKPGYVPEQKEVVSTKTGIERRILPGAFIGMLIGIFPGITPGCGAVMVGTKDTRPEQYITLTSAIEASAFVFNIGALFIIQKTRSGAIATLEQVCGISEKWLNFDAFSPVLALCLFSIALATLCALVLIPAIGLRLLRRAHLFTNRFLQVVILSGMVFSVFLVTGVIGLVVMGVATLVGIIPIVLGLRRIHLMGSILLPVTIILL